MPLRQRQEVQALLRRRSLTDRHRVFPRLRFRLLDRKGRAMRLAARVLLHLFLFLVAILVFFLGLGVGLALSPVLGMLLWFLSGALFVGNLLWLIIFLNNRGETGRA